MILHLMFVLCATLQDPVKPVEEAAKPKETPKGPVVVAVVGGDVFTVTKGRLQGATVLIEDGKIKKVGHGIEIPEGAAVHDAKGLRVLPGFVAVKARNLGLPSNASSTKLADALDPIQEHIRFALGAGITTAHVEHGQGGGLFGARAEAGRAGIVIKLSYGDLEKMTVLEPSYVSLSEWVSGGSQQRQQIRGQLARAREQLTKVRDYEKRKAEGRLAPNEQPPPAGDVMVRLLRGDAIARMDATTADEIRRALQLVSEFQFRCVLVDAGEGWLVADEIGRARAGCIFTPRAREHPSARTGRDGGSSIEQAAILHRAGVTFSFSTLTEGVSFDGLAGRDLQSLPLEAAFAIRGGLDEQTALESLTITAAALLGLDHRIGSIEPGKDGDLILLDGDPFDYRTFVSTAIIEGTVYYERSKTPYLKDFGRR